MTKLIPSDSGGLIEMQLDSHLVDIQNLLKADVIVFVGPIYYGLDTIIRDGVESLRTPQRKTKKPKLVVILETPGGYIEVAERIANTFRKHYRSVEFIIPDSAMSAGTVLVLSGDAIHMDYYSILGPIDPQVQRQDGTMVPALGYLVQYERLIEKSRKGDLTTAELTYLIQSFDSAELYSYEQARDLSITLLMEWLVKYKFKNWRTTEKTGQKVTLEMRRKRATEIARKLNDTERWKSHGRGISMDILRRVLKLKIEDFEKDIALNATLRSYYKLLKDYMGKLSHISILHVNGKYTPLLGSRS